MRDGKRERARDGAQRGRQKKAKWFKSSHASGGTIPYGARGVIVTCDGGKERSAARDVARNLGEQHERARKRASACERGRARKRERKRKRKRTRKRARASARKRSRKLKRA